MPQQGSTSGNRAVLSAVEIKVLSGFVLAMCLLLFGGGYTYRADVEFRNSVEWVAHTQEVRAALADVYGLLAGADLAQRGYLLTTDQAQWNEYLRLAGAVKKRMDDLPALVGDNAAQLQNLAVLKSAVTARLNEMSSGAIALRSFGLPAARAVLRIGRLANTTQDVRAAIDRMDGVEVRLLAGRNRDTARVRNATLVSLLITLAVASALFIALFRGIHREMRARRDSEAGLLEANRFLDSLIENLPVMVFIKDARTLRYVRQNRATLDLLGLSRDDVIGKSDRDFLPPEQADFIQEKDREVLAAGGLVDIPEQSIDTRLLGTRTLHTMKMPILDENGRPKFLLGISVDVTERKLAEHAIRELNAELEANAAQLKATNKELESFSYSVS